MKKILVMMICVAGLVQASAQTDKGGVIHLKGTASTKVMPDVAVVSFSITSHDKAEAEAVNKLNTLTQALIARMVANGFKKEEMKISSYNINEDYAYPDGKPRKLGYIAYNTIVLRFKFDKEKLTNIFGKIMQERTENTSVGFSTELSKELQTTTSNQLIKDAIRNASDRAKLIAGAADLRITGIKEIDYQVNAYHPVPMMAESKMMMNAAGDAGAQPVFANLDVQELELQEDIEVVYLVENIR